jgi:SpoVK/Ycf46/Vps4 family AAA+-type ATPase
MMEKKSPVFVVAASNSLSEIPKPILRKGRFDECFFVDLPIAEERQEIFNIHLRKRKRDAQKFDIGKLVNNTDKYSGAEIEGIIEDAMHMAFSDDREFTTEDILAAISLCNPQYTVVKEDIDRIREESRNRLRPVNMTIKQMMKIKNKESSGSPFENV